MSGAAAATGNERAPRGGPATWVVVLLTLAVVGVVVLAFAGGVGGGLRLAGTVGAAPGTGAAPAPAPAQPSDPNQPGDPGAAPSTGLGAGTLDPCLVGTWRTTEHPESSDTEQGQASLTDLDRTMTFAADGTQTITYDSSQATVTTEQGALPAVFEGTVVYRTSTTASTMSFQLQQADGTVTVLDAAGEVQEERPLEPATGQVSYTCDATTLVQSATGYRSAYEKLT